MAGRIVYDGKTLSVPKIFSFEKIPSIEGNDSFSASGKHEAITIREWDEIQIGMRKLTKSEAATFYPWLAWARQGNVFSFALFDAEDEDTVLDGAANAGQKVIPLSDTSGFSSGHWGLIKKVSDDEYEAVEIDSVAAGISVAAKSNLVNSYAAGDIFQHMDYWPEVIVKDRKTISIQAEGNRFALAFSMVEVS